MSTQETGIPAGWSIDTGDWSVGLCGTEAIHEACPEWDDDFSVIGDDLWREVGRIYKPMPGGGVEVISRIRVTCMSCDATMDVFQWDISSLPDEAYL